MGFWVRQFAGAIVAAGVLKFLVSSGGVTDETGGLGSNAYDNGTINLTGALVFEVLATAAFILVILMVTDRFATAAAAGLAIGAALTAIHTFGIPLDGTSVNPARSLGPALFAGSHALTGLAVHRRAAGRWCARRTDLPADPAGRRGRRTGRPRLTCARCP